MAGTPDSKAGLDNGHADNTAPKTIDGHKFVSFSTFIPLTTEPHSVNVKTALGVIGK